MLFPARGAKGDVGAGVVAAGERGDRTGAPDGARDGATRPELESAGTTGTETLEPVSME